MTTSGPLRVFISAGESSGDLHAAGLIEELRSRGDISVEGIGGSRMEEAGARIIFPMEKLSVVGLSEVLLKLPSLARAYLKTRKRWRNHLPHLFIPVDFPGFNIRLAQMAHSMGIPVMYYIAPQVWAWGSGRLKTMKKVISKVAVILPFEEKFFQSEGIPVGYVGHPLVDSVQPKVGRETFRSTFGFAEDTPLIGLLPGSRRHEVDRLLPPMLRAFKELKKKHPACRAAIGLAGTIPEDRVRLVAREVGLNPRVVKGSTYELIEASDALLAASGTVTLEAAILRTPMIVVYSMSWLTHAVARRVVRTKHIGLVNLVAGKRVVPEFVQDEVIPSVLCKELESMLFDIERRGRLVAELERVREKLGEPGASGRAADLALETVGWEMA